MGEREKETERERETERKRERYVYLDSPAPEETKGPGLDDVVHGGERHAHGDEE